MRYIVEYADSGRIKEVSEYDFDHYSEHQGLPDARIRCYLIADHMDGYTPKEVEPSYWW